MKVWDLDEEYNVIKAEQLNNTEDNKQMKFKTSNEESKDFEKPHIKEGLYPAELKEVKEISDGTYGKRVAFIYSIIDQDVELAFICYSENEASPANKLGQTLQAHGVDLGKEIDTDPLIGTKAQVLVEDYNLKDDVKASSISKVKPLAEKA